MFSPAHLLFSRRMAQVHLEVIMACPSGPMGIWVIRAERAWVERSVPSPCSSLFIPWHLPLIWEGQWFLLQMVDVLLFPTSSQGSLIETLWQLVGACGKSRLWHKAILEEHPPAVYCELHLPISSPQQRPHWGRISTKSRGLRRGRCHCTRWPERTFPMWTADFWTQANCWLYFLDTAPTRIPSAPRASAGFRRHVFLLPSALLLPHHHLRPRTSQAHYDSLTKLF